jgi:hypothetical protein
MRSLRIAALGLCSLLMPGVFAQTAQDWRFAHPGATLVGGVRVTGLLQSPILNSLIEQNTAKDPTSAAMVAAIRTALSGVSEIRFSVEDNGTSQPDVLAMITGHLDDAAAASLAQGKATLRRIDPDHLLIGEGSSLDDAVRRLNEPPVKLESRAVEKARPMANYDVWLAGALPETPITASLSEMLKGLALGMSLGNDFKLEVALDTASAKMAEDLVSKAIETQKQQQQAIGGTLNAMVDGATARFRFEMEGSRVAQAIQDAIAKGGLPQVSGLVPPQASQPAAAPKEPERKTVIIYGLDNGPKEVDPGARP